MANAETVYLNGEYMPLEQARVPVLDRGFIFGDGIYEVVPVYGGHPFRLDHHLARLARSLRLVGMDNPHSDREWAGVLEALIRHNGGGDLSLYLQITRGVARRDHAFPPDVPPTIFAMASPLKSPDAETRARGLAAIAIDDPRWRHCDIKSISLLPNVLLRQQAQEAGADEAILIRDGTITEGAASNVFVVRDGLLRTPPKGPDLLPGITRDLVLELAGAEGLPAEEATLDRDDLRAADEIWLTSSTKEVMAVTRLDGQPVGDGRPGPVWHRIDAIYQAYKARLREGPEETV